MRKLFLALAAMLFMTGLVAAAEMNVTKFDKEKKEVTVKDGDKETVYKVTEKVKVTIIDKDGKDTEGKYEYLEKRLGKIGKNGLKMDLTVEKETITEAKFKAGKK